ncbi:hypothetical protein BRC86_13530 [Halobacteriales archaeon QS_3_64_16]|jgi:hypothetical protein|nr:MAG: hypothetical protein BRC86_13530 [Halobacteriales archaeon QS_3_64_16]
MASCANESGFDALLRSLVAHRLAVYVGGLAIIALPALLRGALDLDVPATIRTLLVAAALGAMILTYLGERRVADEAANGEQRTQPNAGNRTPEGAASTAEPGYSRRTRTTVAIGLIGLAVGIYVAIEIDTIIGVLFVVGGLLFGQSALREEGNESKQGEEEV